MRAGTCGNEDDSVESDVIAYCFSNEKMSVMNRIEPAAEDPDIDRPTPLTVSKLDARDTDGIAVRNAELAQPLFDTELR